MYACKRLVSEWKSTFLTSRWQRSLLFPLRIMTWRNASCFNMLACTFLAGRLQMPHRVVFDQAGQTGGYLRSGSQRAPLRSEDLAQWPLI